MLLGTLWTRSRWLGCRRRRRLHDLFVLFWQSLDVGLGSGRILLVRWHGHRLHLSGDLWRIPRSERVLVRPRIYRGGVQWYY